MNPLHKFFSPRLSTLVLRRARLVETLLEATADESRPSAGLEASTLSKLILVHGPAGYGKTTVLTDFARQTNLPCCWYFLDETDRNPILFLQGLVASLCHCFPQFGQTLDLNTAHLITEDIQNLARMRAFEMFIDKLTLTLEKELKQKFLLILCNYHVVNAHQGIQHLTQYLLQHLPSHCFLIIESRSLPDLDLSSFVLHGNLLVLGADRLSFTAQEVYDLAQLRGIAHIGRAEAEQLATNFDGWIAGILLGTYFGDMRFLSSRQDTSEQWKFPALQTGQKQLVNYVLNEVFESKLDLFTFLQEISLLPYITIELCNDLLEISDAGERLMYIEQQGLFITRGGDTSSLVYFCHPVLRELFCRELREHNPARCLYLHGRAATLFLRQEEYAQAITHAIHAREYQLAAEALAQFSQHMLVQGYSETIASWIDMLPDEVIGNYPPLLLSRANIFLMQYKADIALPLLDRALESTTRSHGEKAWPPTVQGDVLIARGFALFQQGEYLQAQASCEQAIQLLPEEEYFLRALAYQRLGVCRGAMGDCKGGIVYLQQSLQLWGHQTLNRQTAFLYGQLAKSYNLLGNYTLAQHH
ncbi:MAG TPA: hypothetical protein VFV38_33535, partial [Ktedonobacteraceae bacterium]|nr:hypothetical protein [Ktedonobacteraceae bacterium]